MNEDRSPFPTSDLVGFGDITYMNEDKTKALEEFEKWRVPFFGKHNPYPVEAATYFGAGFDAGLRAQSSSATMRAALERTKGAWKVLRTACSYEKLPSASAIIGQADAEIGSIDAALNAGGEGSETSSTK